MGKGIDMGKYWKQVTYNSIRVLSEHSGTRGLTGAYAGDSEIAYP